MSKNKIVKQIKVNLDKCIGCRACEIACSGFHAKPKYSSINPARSRIRVDLDLQKNLYVPVRAGDYTPTECSGRIIFTIKGKEYSECSFCSVSCPARDLFKEPDSGLPLKCDMCEDVPALSEPMCVQVCRPGALTYEVREEKRVEDSKLGKMEIGLQKLINRHGLEKVMEMVGRMSNKG